MQTTQQSVIAKPVDALKARVLNSASALRALVKSTDILMSADGTAMMFNKGFSQFSKTRPRN